MLITVAVNCSYAAPGKERMNLFFPPTNMTDNSKRTQIVQFYSDLLD